MEYERVSLQEFHDQLLATVDNMLISMSEEGESRSMIAPTYVLFAPCRDDVGKDVVTQVNIDLDDSDASSDEAIEAVQELINDQAASRVALISVGYRMETDTDAEALSIGQSAHADEVLEEFGDPYVGVITTTSRQMHASLRCFKDSNGERVYEDWEHSGWIDLGSLESPKHVIGFHFELHPERES